MVQGAQTVITGITSDFIKPGRETTLTIIFTQRQPHLYKGFLYHIFSFIFVAQQSESKPEYKWLKRRNQQRECYCILLLAPTYKLLYFFLVHHNNIFVYYMIRKKHFQVNYRKPNIINILSNKFINKLFTKHFILVIHSTSMLNKKVNCAKVR